MSRKEILSLMGGVFLIVGTAEAIQNGYAKLGDFSPVMPILIAGAFFGILAWGFKPRIERWARNESPKVEVEVADVLSSSSDQRLAQTFDLSQGFHDVEEMKWQPLLVTARTSRIESCTVGVEIAYKGKQESMHLVWPYPEMRKIEVDQVTVMSVRSSMPLNPDDPVQLIVWYALKGSIPLKPTQEKFYLVTDSIVGLALGPELEPIEMSITFYSKDGQVNKKAFRFIFHAGSWDRLGLEMVKNQDSSPLKDKFSFLSNLRSRSHPSIMVFRPVWRTRVRRTV